MIENDFWKNIQSIYFIDTDRKRSKVCIKIIIYDKYEIHFCTRQND